MALRTGANYYLVAAENSLWFQIKSYKSPSDLIDRQCTERNAAGELTGVNPCSQQEFTDRTPSMKTTICGLEITNTISIDGYTSNIEVMVKERIYELSSWYFTAMHILFILDF